MTPPAPSVFPPLSGPSFGPSLPLAFHAKGQDQGAPSPRALPHETAVALSFNGSAQAVMMATPADLTDFIYGFALTEGIAQPKDFQDLKLHQEPRGIDIQAWLSSDAAERLQKRRRRMAGPVGCGLCGIDSITEALRDQPPLPDDNLRLTPDAIMAAIAALPAHQPLHDATRAAHCAAFYHEGAVIAAREDVGRHNALDKLAGHLARQAAAQHPGAAQKSGAVLLTSRVSIDLVQKVAAMGQPIMIAVSAPTADAVALAQALNITLIGLARPDRFEVFTHPHRISPTANDDVTINPQAGQTKGSKTAPHPHPSGREHHVHNR